MHAEIIYFSQTGNTRRVASTIAATMVAAGMTADITPMKRARRDKLADADIIGIGSATYNSQAPSPVKKFLSSLPSLKGKMAFVFATSGGAPGRVLYDLAEGLRQNDANVVASFIARGKVAHPIPPLFGRFPDSPNRDEFDRASEFATDLVAKISGNGNGKIRWTRSEAFDTPSDFYGMVGTALSDNMIRKLMPEPHLDENRCAICRWCMFSCPTNNIRMTPYPTIGASCIRCYRCVTGCPRKSFTISWGDSVKVVEALYNVELIKRLGDVSPDEEIY